MLRLNKNNRESIESYYRTFIIMSSAPAVPTAERKTAPTTQVDSTQSAPHGQSVSGIGGAGPSSAEGAEHSGAFNTVDIYLRMQFIAFASFLWTTAQQPGTLLWSTPISPKNSHQFIRHLSLMYNTWVGGFDFNFKLCGTGFHSGALAIVRVPPNIKPSSITSPADFTAFEYVIIDPKTLEIVSKHVIDQRRTMYHYGEDQGIEAIGGHIAVYVLVSLAASSSGNQQIGCQVLTRPSPDFNFFQIKPLQGDSPIVTPDEPQALAECLDMRIDNFGTGTWTGPVSNIIISPPSIERAPASVYGCYGLDGKPIVENSVGDYPLPLTQWTNILESEETFRIRPSVLKNLPLGVQPTALSVFYNTSSTGIIKGEICTTMYGPGEWRSSSSASENTTCSYKINKWLEATNLTPSKDNAEGYVFFQQEADVFSHQTIALASALKTGEFSQTFTSQQCMIIDMYDAELDIPVRRFKLSHRGILTAKNTTSDQIVLPATKYYFKFVQISLVGEPIPSPPKQYAANQIISNIAHAPSKQNYQPPSKPFKSVEWQASSDSLEPTS